MFAWIKAALTITSAWFERQANRNQLFRRSVLLWACTLITWVTVEVFTETPNVPSGTATALGIVVGILATVIGFYQWHRKANSDTPPDDR